MKMFHRTPRIELGSRVAGNVELGLSLRQDQINQVQNLLQQPENEVWDHRVDATLSASDLGAYVDGISVQGSSTCEADIERTRSTST